VVCQNSHKKKEGFLKKKSRQAAKRARTSAGEPRKDMRSDAQTDKKGRSKFTVKMASTSPIRNPS